MTMFLTASEENPVGNVFYFRKIVSPTDDIQEMTILPALDIFPNPNKGWFRIAVPSVFSNSLTITIYDSLGKKVFSKVADNNSSIEIATKLPSGIYQVEVLDDNRNKASQKLIIQ